MAKTKLDAKKLKEEFDSLDDDDKKSLLEVLGVESPDDVDFKKSVLARLDKIEKGGEKKKPGGFFSQFFTQET